MGTLELKIYKKTRIEQKIVIILKKTI